VCGGVVTKVTALISIESLRYIYIYIYLKGEKDRNVYIVDERRLNNPYNNNPECAVLHALHLKKPSIFPIPLILHVLYIVQAERFRLNFSISIH